MFFVRRFTVKTRICSFILAASMFSLPHVGYSNVGTTTGTMLLEWCTEGDDSYKALCIIYIDGVLQGIDVGSNVAFLSIFNMVVVDVPEETYQKLKKLNTSGLLGYCIPEGVSVAQIKDVIVNYLEKKPQTRHELGNVLIFKAIKEAFPCETL